MSTRKYALDSTHSSLGFSVRHMVISKVHGRFDKWTLDLELDEKDLSKSKIDVTIDVSSIDTKEGTRDNHLRSPDFFDAPNFPTATFKSKRIEGKGESFKVVGDLTIRGTTKEIVLDAEFNGLGKDPWGGTRAGFSAKTSINRTEFGLHWNKALEAGGVLVGEKVELAIEVEAIQQAVAVAA